jgi:hypothetical protein
MAVAAGVNSRSVRPDLWHVCVEVRELAMLDDGRPTPDRTADQDLYFPCCFPDASEMPEHNPGRLQRARKNILSS